MNFSFSVTEIAGADWRTKCLLNSAIRCARFPLAQLVRLRAAGSDGAAVVTAVATPAPEAATLFQDDPKSLLLLLSLLMLLLLVLVFLDKANQLGTLFLMLLILLLGLPLNSVCSERPFACL